MDSVRTLTREDVIDFYERHYVPGNASLVVVGDVETERITADLEARFGRWPPGPIPPPPPLPRSPWPTTEPAIYLIDKPGATQSVISVGRIAASINSPDRQRLIVLNENLKGRVNSTLRDDRADTYGFSSTIDFRNDLGPFVLTGSVSTSTTSQTLATILKEMNDLASHQARHPRGIDHDQEGHGPGVDQPVRNDRRRRRGSCLSGVARVAR